MSDFQAKMDSWEKAFERAYESIPEEATHEELADGYRRAFEIIDSVAREAIAECLMSPRYFRQATSDPADTAANQGAQS